MKQKEILTIILTVVVSIALSVIISNIFFSGQSAKNQQVDVVPPISTNFSLPSKQFFNSKSIDPTQIINIGPSNNQQIFSNPVN